ncbi:MAG: toxin HipA [Bacteroidetes bacterium HGW-Bacteroidetes-11]|jgi:serine/threonine-protein kinase HipA|nr:MAG: toxin HipA [Bacteroidetes bacterium HGW-Bacteroidetes-11]
MRKAKVFVSDKEAGVLYESELGKSYRFSYLANYAGLPVSLTMPTSQRIYEFNTFPPFFDGLLPEGYQLEGLLKTGKIDRNDMFSQLLAVGDDLVGNVTIKEAFDHDSNDGIRPFNGEDQS